MRDQPPPCPKTYDDPGLQRDFERWWNKAHRVLSTAEQAGWRRFWDGWCICPPCQVDHGAGYTPETWRVPANYDTPIKATDRCMKCRRTPPEVINPVFLTAAIMDIYSHG